MVKSTPGNLVGSDLQRGRRKEKLLRFLPPNRGRQKGKKEEKLLAIFTTSPDKRGKNQIMHTPQGRRGGGGKRRKKNPEKIRKQLPNREEEKKSFRELTSSN